MKELFFAQKESPHQLTISSARDCTITDSEGRQYLDLMSGWCVGNLGWGNKRIAGAVQKYRGPDYVYPGFKYEPWFMLAERLAEISPGNLQHCYRTTGGSESVDTALQMAMAYTGRKKFCSIEGSYHGNVISALSIGDSSTAGELKNRLSNCLKVEIPLDRACLKKVETRLKSRDVAAFIMEPVLCNAGVHIPEKEFMDGLRERCSHYGTLLIADEVATGFGRCGKIFASEHFNFSPDILCLGKAISSGYGPMGATVVTAAVHRKVQKKVSIYSTYGWHPLSTAAALATINFFQKEGKELFAGVEQRSQEFRTALSQMKFKKNGKLNVIGLAIAVDVDEKKYAEKIRDTCFKKGLIVSSQDSKLVMFPALTIRKEDVKRALKIIEDSI